MTDKAKITISDNGIFISHSSRTGSGANFKADTMHRRHERAAIMLRPIFKEQYGEQRHRAAMLKFVEAADRRGLRFAIDRLRYEPNRYAQRQAGAKSWERPDRPRPRFDRRQNPNWWNDRRSEEQRHVDAMHIERPSRNRQE